MNVERDEVEFHKNWKSVRELQGKVNEQNKDLRTEENLMDLGQFHSINGVEAHIL